MRAAPVTFGPLESGAGALMQGLHNQLEQEPLTEGELDVPQSVGRCSRGLRAGVLTAALTVVCTLLMFTMPRAKGPLLRQQTSAVEQKWNTWGLCSAMAQGTAYLYAAPPKNKLPYVPSAGQCCLYCHGMARCQSWTWIQRTGDCYMEETLPIRNITKSGYWVGVSQGFHQGLSGSGPYPLAPSPVPATGFPPAPAPVPVVGPYQPSPVPGPIPAVGPYQPVPAPGPVPAVGPYTPVPNPAPMPPMPVPAPQPVPAPSAGPSEPTSPGIGASSRAGGEAIVGGAASKAAFAGFLALWRDSYQENDGSVPDLPDTDLPQAFQNIPTKIVVSSGGAAGGVVTEGMGYGIMVEAFKAVTGERTGLLNGLALLRGWLGMVKGPASTPHPFGGGTEKGGATSVDTYPYGVSAIPGALAGGAPSGVAGWKFPIDQCYPKCQGSATDGDEDAVLGMIYLAAALQNPQDFVDMVMRAVISFASADLGFPDLYRTLPDGTKIFVAKGGSQWGGLLPEHGKYASSQEPWCYNPSYFAPGHYRSFRDFVRKHWSPSFNRYLPPHLDGTPSTSRELMDALDGAVVGGYNILYYSSCESGAVGNWVGVKAECPDKEGLSCPGVPWATTPYVGTSGTCTASGTMFGSYGPDASRTPWRIAMDYILHTKESVDVPMYNQEGRLKAGLKFNAQIYLNRMANQYRNHAQCDGAKGDCTAVGTSSTATFKLAVAFDQGPHMTCGNVPNAAQSWWASFMAWPTFTAFVAPIEAVSAQDSMAWLDTLASNCEFSGSTPTGNICQSSYFELGQEVISTMVMAGAVVPLQGQGQPGSPFK